MRKAHQVNVILLCMIVFSVFNLSAQLEFQKDEQFIFFGSRNVEGKQIIVGGYVIPLDNFNLRLKMDIADDWVLKDSLDEQVSLDKRSFKKDRFFIEKDSMSYPAYRFSNKSGLKILITKGIFDKSDRVYAQIYLPKKRKSYVRSLPLMFEK